MKKISLSWITFNKYNGLEFVCPEPLSLCCVFFLLFSLIWEWHIVEHYDCGEPGRYYENFFLLTCTFLVAFLIFLIIFFHFVSFVSILRTNIFLITLRYASNRTMWMLNASTNSKNYFPSFSFFFFNLCIHCIHAANCTLHILYELLCKAIWSVYCTWNYQHCITWPYA